MPRVTTPSAKGLAGGRRYRPRRAISVREAYGPGCPTVGVDRSPLVVGLAATFAGMTVLLLVVAAVLRDVVLLFVALPFGVVTYVFWYRATGRVRAGLFERARQRRARREETPGGRADDGRGDRRGRSAGGFGAGPRAGGGARTRAGRRARAGDRRSEGEVPPSGADAGPSRREAYATLGLDRGADEEAVRRAYREQVKDVHPDSGGDEAAFRELTRAYERLTD